MTTFSSIVINLLYQNTTLQHYSFTGRRRKNWILEINFSRKSSIRKEEFQIYPTLNSTIINILNCFVVQNLYRTRDNTLYNVGQGNNTQVSNVETFLREFTEIRYTKLNAKGD